MTHKERAAKALTLQIPDFVPTFELEFQLAEEMFGRKLVPDELNESELLKLSEKEQDKLLYDTAEFFAYVYGELDYSIIPAYGPRISSKPEDGYVHSLTKRFIKILKEVTQDKVMLGYHGDGTFAIPDGNRMYEFAYRIADDPDGIKKDARFWADFAVERNKRLQEAGIDCLFLCSDYCYNSGPFISPAMFREFITPYLYDIIAAARNQGLYTIKHTDGNIMPILDQLVECRPHALHSIDPMAGVDIKLVKELYGDKVALCGNVHCAAMQTGTLQEVIDSATYCLTHAKPNGGYLFCTSNVPFKGMPPERYSLILDIWKEMRHY